MKRTLVSVPMIQPPSSSPIPRESSNAAISIHTVEPATGPRQAKNKKRRPGLSRSIGGSRLFPEIVWVIATS